METCRGIPVQRRLLLKKNLVHLYVRVGGRFVIGDDLWKAFLRDGLFAGRMFCSEGRFEVRTFCR